MSAIDTLMEAVEKALKPDFVVAELRVDGLDSGQVLSLRGTEQISQLFRYEVEVELDGPPPDLSFVIGAPASLLMRDATANARTVFGIVAEIQARSFDADTYRATLVLRPKVYRQFLGRDCFAMQDITTVDVVKDVLADYTGKVRYELVRDYPKYPYRVQYREDDWTYVSRICEEEGIYYWFDHEDDDSAVVFADNSTSAPAIEGIPVLPFTPASSMRPDQEAVVDVSFEAKMASTKFSGKSFDPDRPLLGIAASAGNGRREDYDAPGAGPVEPAVLQRRIQDRREASIAARSGVAGVATTTRFTPGRTFTLIGHPVPVFDAELLITKVEVEGTLKRPVVTRFSAIPKSVMFRPPQVSPVAKQAGFQMALVVGPDGQEVHTDPRGRVRAQMHWDRLGKRNESGGTWMRIAQRGAPGSMLYPRMGWNVSTFNEEGGVDVPSIVCRVHDAEHPPAYKLPENMTRVVFKTATTPDDGSHNEIYFEDATGREEMFINASKDWNGRTRNIKTEFIENDSSREVGVDHELHVDKDMLERVNGNQQIQIGANERLEAQTSVSKAVTGNETRSIGGSRTLKAGESTNITVTGNRTLSVGAAMLDLSLGEIEAHSTKNALNAVGGALLRVAGQSITDALEGTSVQLVGAMKMEFAKAERTTTVSKTMNETIGGSLDIRTNAEFIDNADKLEEITVIGGLSGTAPEVWVEATKSLRIKCGETVITVTTDTVRFEGSTLDLSGAHIDADTTQIEHN